MIHPAIGVPRGRVTSTKGEDASRAGKSKKGVDAVMTRPGLRKIKRGTPEYALGPFELCCTQHLPPRPPLCFILCFGSVAIPECPEHLSASSPSHQQPTHSFISPKYPKKGRRLARSIVYQPPSDTHHVHFSLTRLAHGRKQIKVSSCFARQYSGAPRTRCISSIEGVSTGPSIWYRSDLLAS
jgi:hypothetical protein